MRILQINSVYNIGSTGIICRSISEALNADQHQAITLYGRWPVQHDLPYAQYFGNRVSTYFHVGMTRLFDRNGLHSNGSTKQCIELIKDFEPDLIHLHNIHGYFLNYKILFNFFKKLGKPIVWTLHDCWTFTGHCPYFTKSGCEKWRSSCGNCPSLLDYPASWIVDRTRKNFIDKRESFTGVKDLILVAPSQWLVDLTRDSFLQEYPAVVIPNGIKLDDIKGTKDLELRHKIARGKKYVFLAVAGVWDDRKNLNAVNQAADKFKDVASTVVVGKIKGRSNQLADSILHIPHTYDRQYLMDLFASADLFLNPTLEDNFPTVNLEAVANRLPVITFETGGSPAAMMGYGAVTEENTAASLIESIDKWLAGTLDVGVPPPLEQLDYRCMVQKYIDLYHSVIR
ncbi:MAG: glycosyltransferase [Fastidiosipilaceae bacterium]|nr:glycosyltransferase [Clostridiaceae bacterium]